jgi:hypothetical protein
VFYPQETPKITYNFSWRIPRKEKAARISKPDEKQLITVPTTHRD